MRTHVTILAWLHIVMGVMSLFGGAIAFLFLGGAAGVAAATGGPGTGPVAGLMAFFGTAFLLIVALFALPQLLLGWGLLRGASWARILGIIMSILSLLHPVVGIYTALGIYGLVILFNSETVAMFDGPRMRSY
jgi:hypothetical protein